jgi:hypothetical protein
VIWVLLLLLILALLIFGVVGTIKIAFWLVVFVILAVGILVIVGALRYRGGRGST